MQTVALLFGGRSSEHGISCVTAGGILRQIDRARYRVIPIGITRSGRFVEVSDNPDEWQIVDGVAPEVPDAGDEVLLQQPAVPSGPALLRVIRGGMVQDLAEVDVIFPVLHGPYGEDGTIQGMLDLVDVPYVGSGVLASAAGQDKDVTKRLLRGAGLEVAPGVVVHRSDLANPREREALRGAIADLGLPLFVKPARAGSSMGVTRVAALEDLDAALDVAFAHDPKVLVEAGITGREVECGVLSGGDGEAPRTTAPGEVAIGDDLEFYDYESKYFGKGTVTIEIPAAISDQDVAAVRDVAARAFVALGLEGLARIDVFVTAGGEIIVNEVNTMPGFTHISMFPVLWDNMGLAYPDLITDLIEHALAKPRGLR